MVGSPAARPATHAYLVEYGAPGQPAVPTTATTTMTVVPPAVPTVPEAPTGVSPQAGEGMATVSWTAPAYEGSSPVDNFTVSVFGDDEAVGPTCTVAAPATSCDVPGLRNGTAYTFSVVASNAAGASPSSARSAAVTPRLGTALSISGVPATLTAGATLDLTASVVTTTPAAGTPSGSVTFLVDGIELDTVDLEQGVAHLTSPATAAGTHVFEVSYPGNGAFAPAPGASASVEVVPTAPPTTVPPPATTVSPTTAVPATTAPTTSAPASTESPTTVAETTSTDAESPSADATSAAAAATTPRITIVFGVGVGADAEGARITVRGQGLRPDSSTDVTVHSDPALLDTVAVPASGSFQQDVVLPHLEDGEHMIVATGVSHDGTPIERQLGFAVDGGKLSRIGMAYTSAAEAGASPDTGRRSGAADPTPAAQPASPGHHPPVLLLLLVLAALSGLVYLVWRIRQGRTAITPAKPADRLPGSITAGPLVLRSTSAQSVTGLQRSR